MRAPNSPRPLRATSSSVFALVFSSIVLSIVLLASPASTRSVPGHQEVRAAGHVVIDGKLSLEGHGTSDEAPGSNQHEFFESHGIFKRDNAEKNIFKDEKLPLATEISPPIEEHGMIGKSTVNSEFGSAKSEGRVKNKYDEGIRRFDEVVVNEEAQRVKDSEIGRTVIKGIIVRDAPTDSGIDEEPELVPEVVELSGVKVHRKRSLVNSKLASETIEAVEGESSTTKENIEVANDASEKIADSAKSGQVPVLNPVDSSHAKSKRAEKVPAVEASLVQEKKNVPDLLPDKESSVKVQAETVKEETVKAIPVLTETGASVLSSDESAQMEEIVIFEPKKIIINEDGLGEVIDKLENGESAVLTTRKSLPISEESEKDEKNEERLVRSEEDTKIGQEVPNLEEIDESKKDEEISRSETNEESYSLSLASVIRTNESLEDLKAQAISLQREIRDETYLQSLREQATEILPGIPKFTEIQVLDALKAILSLKKSVESPELSYLSKVDTSILNDRQLQILKYSETLLSREQRPTFAQNMMDCIISWSILNCMKIFVWPIIADNIPESFTQNLPTLPIEINISDWLPGNQRDKPKATTFRSASSPYQQRLITPEIVVSGILKDALDANPAKISDALPTFINPQNETLSKWLTPGQLEILKMAEKFLPESTRQEYSNRMFSCVRRFEYFSCVKYFAWPIVKQHYAALPDFPDYQSWYPSITLYPGYPILPYPNTEGIGELPEVVEADATRTRSPRPETVIVQILENALRQTSGYPGYQTYQARQPAFVMTQITPDQMAIFYTAEQLIPEQLRTEYMAKTMKCIRDFDYLTCTKYSTWPTVRQWFPNLPQFPDFSSWIPTFTVPELPNFSQYITDIASYFSNFPGFPGSSGDSKPKPQPASEPKPQPIPDKPPQEEGATVLSKVDQRMAGSTVPIQHRIIHILSNIRGISPIKNAQQIASVTPESLAVLRMLTYNELRILGLAKNAIPALVQGDLDSRFVGCLQGDSDFINCTRKVIWPTLQLYVKDMPIFPEEKTNLAMEKYSEATYSFPAMKPGVYQPIIDPAEGLQPVFVEKPVQIVGRAPTGSQIVAEPEISTIPVSQPQAGSQILQDAPSNQDSVASLRQGASAKSNDPAIPVISVTDTRFTPVFSDHPETVLLKILTTIQSSAKYVDSSYTLEKPGHLEFLNDYLNTDQRRVIRVTENLLPDEVKLNFMERVKGCVEKSNFIVCSRDVIWPSLSQYYQRLPSFPNFYINDSNEKIDAAPLGTMKSVLPGAAAISETDVKTGQHGDAMVTITDTRFVPIFSQHPEEVILSILRNVQATSPNLSAQTGATKVAIRSSEFMATFTDQQGNIVTVAESVLPESIREVFTKKMSECVKENSFLACMRDIAWPTIAQFFPRLPNFPNIGALPDFAVEKPQHPALLPPQLEPAKPSLAPVDLGLAMPTENLVPVTPEDVESRIEATLKQLSSPSKSIEPKISFLNIKDPVVASFVTERQANVIRLCEDMLPNAVKPLFVGKMVDCARGDVFPNCVRNIGWPTLRQYVPNFPEFPDFGSYIPQLPQGLPQFPQLPDYQIPEIPQIPQIPQIPNFPDFQLPGQGFGFPFRAAHDEIGQEPSLIPVTRQHLQPGAVFVPGIQGLTPSVESASTVDPSSSGFSELSPPLVPEFSGQPTGLLSDVPLEERRKRRYISEEPTENYQDNNSDNFEPQFPSNITESEFLKVLVNITKQNEEDTRDRDEYFVETLNSTMKNPLTTEQLAILKIVEDISSQTAKGFMSKVFQCIRGLSFIRCMGIFVWPVITQNVPSLLGLPALGSLNPFGRSSADKDSFEDIFGMTSKDFEKELLQRKENVEEILIDWYRGVVEKTYDNDYGFLRVQGYGDGEVGISFNGFQRKGRGAKFKDSKNMPSILTIISDIMEDMLDQRDSKPEKKEHGKRDRSLREENDYNRVSGEHNRHKDSERSSNDDQIIAMFLDKIKANSTGDSGTAGESNGDHYLSVEDAYDAFELLFGTRLSKRIAEKLHDLDKNYYRTVNDEKSSHLLRKLHKMLVKSSEEPRNSLKTVIESEQSEKNGESDKIEKKKKIRSGLVLRLPKIEEEFVSRKITSGLVELGRKMKMQMSQIVPGISFLISFFVQMALAHARAAASVAGIMSNMALGSAVMSMIRQSLFGSMDPKIKHVYDIAPMGPGVSWPEHNYHG